MIWKHSRSFHDAHHEFWESTPTKFGLWWWDESLSGGIRLGHYEGRYSTTFQYTVGDPL